MALSERTVEELLTDLWKGLKGEILTFRNITMNSELRNVGDCDMRDTTITIKISEEIRH